MGRLLIGACASAALLLASAVDAYELDVSIDLRAVSSDATNSRLEGGLGKLRYDATDEGLRLRYLRLGYRLDVTQTLRVTGEAAAYADHDVNALDLTELYAEWRPIPSSSWRSRLKVGAFYPEISLENRMRGWRSPYTLSCSAINAWIGEEVRAIGAEYSLDLLGRSQGHAFDLTFNAPAFGWNDAAGTVLASRGWGVHDRESSLFGRFANGGQQVPERTLFYDDLDKRAGYYAGVSANYRGLMEARMLHYDNRARLSPDNPKIQDDPWETYFDSLGLRLTPTAEWTLITQWLHGRTYDGIGPPANAWTFNSDFLLASWKRGPMRYSARYDRFMTQQTASNFIQYIGFYLGDDGHAWTLAGERELSRHWSAVLEVIQADSTVAQRAFTGEALAQRERQWQLAIRHEK